MTYNLSMFSVTCKCTFFKTYCINYQLKFVLFCVHGQSGLEIKIQYHSWTCFDTTNLMAVSNLVNKLMLKIAFFDISIITGLREISIF